MSRKSPQTLQIIDALKRRETATAIAQRLNIPRITVYRVAQTYGLTCARGLQTRPKGRACVMGGRKLAGSPEPWLRVSAPVLRHLGWKPRDTVTMKAENGRIVIERENHASP